jgi:hypothetical protein
MIEFLLDLIRYIKGFFYGVRNLFLWVPVVWSDRNWDNGYLVRIVEHKLRLMEKFFGSNKVQKMGSLKTLRRIKTARIIASRIINRRYRDNAMFWFKKKHVLHSWWPMEDKTTEEYKFYRRCSKHSRYMREQDWNYLWKLIEKYGETWND